MSLLCNVFYLICSKETLNCSWNTVFIVCCIFSSGMQIPYPDQNAVFSISCILRSKRLAIARAILVRRASDSACEPFILAQMPPFLYTVPLFMANKLQIFTEYHSYYTVSLVPSIQTPNPDQNAVLTIYCILRSKQLTIAQAVLAKPELLILHVNQDKLINFLYEVF